MSALCTDLHAVNTTLELNGFDSGLLCSMVPFANAVRAAIRADVPLQAGNVLPVRAAAASSPATTSSSSRCATCWPRSCRWRPTSSAGWRSGRRRGCERDADAPDERARARCWRRTTSSAGPRAASSTRSSSWPRRSPACRSPRSTSSAPSSQHQVATSGFEGGDTPIETTPCAASWWSPGEPIMVEDAGTDERFADNPWTTGDDRRGQVLRIPPAAHAGRRGDRHAVRLRQRVAPGDAGVRQGPGPARRPGRRRARARARLPPAQRGQRAAQHVQRAAGALRRAGQPRPQEPADVGVAVARVAGARRDRGRPARHRSPARGAASTGWTG